MKRREFIAAAGSTFVWPARVLSQQRLSTKQIAVVHPIVSPDVMNEKVGDPFFSTFFAELRRLGYAEGENLLVERRSGEGKTERYAQVARELVNLKPDVMLVVSARILAYFREATSTIPIVAITGDPILFGIVSNVSRPEGNVTGFSADASIEIHGKYLEILKEMNPKLSRVGLLSAKLSWEPYGRPLEEIAKRMGLTIIGPPLDHPFGEAEIRSVIAAMVQDGANGLLVSAAAENHPHARLIVELAEKNRLVAIYPFARYTELGGLAAYAVDLGDIGRRAAGYVHKLLQGTKPGELPYYKPTKLQLIINLKAARALDLTVPPSLLVRADEVIE